MRRYKYRVTRLFHIALWGIILLLSLNVLIKCIRIFGPEAESTLTDTIGQKIVTAACNYMLESNIPILGYVSGRDENKNKSFILNTMLGSFPINRYIAQASDEPGSNYIENEMDTLKLADEDSLLFNNDLYVQRIIEGIEHANSLTKAAKGNGVQNNSSVKDAVPASSSGGIMPIDIINGEVYLESEETTIADDAVSQTLGTINGERFDMKQLLNHQFLYNNFYIVDPATVVNDQLFDVKKFIGEDMTMKTTSDKPQILIYHTHSQETYSDSKGTEESETVVGVGTYLTKLLEDNYGYNVIHDKSKYDIMGGELDRNLAYNYAGDGIEKILKEYPSIEVVIDLHRDGANGKRVAKIKGEDTAQVMLFNGLSRTPKGDIARLSNPYLQDNLAFSLQLQLKGREIFPGLMYKNYLMAYRYNMHLRKKSILAEVGTDKNTLEEAMNAMKYLSEVIYDVLSGEGKEG